MRRKADRKRKLGRQILWLLVLLLVLAATLFLRYMRLGADAPAEPAVAEAAATPEPRPEPTPEAFSVSETEAAESPLPDEPTPEPAVTPESEAEPSFTAPLGYTERSYQLVSDLIQVYREEQQEGEEQIASLLEELKQEDAALGTSWEGIMRYWNYVNSELQICYDVLPDELPQDDSLCLVVMGFQLMPDGSMASELIERCETALACAQQYPNAYIAVTGGGTARENKAATEARTMEAWFLRRGIEPERLIVEDMSLTSAENAKFLGQMLVSGYPQVKQLAIITSDYHVRLSCLLFEEEALLGEYETGSAPFHVTANAACSVPALAGTEGIKKQAQYIWVLADPHY